MSTLPSTCRARKRFGAHTRRRVRKLRRPARKRFGSHTHRRVRKLRRLVRKRLCSHTRRRVRKFRRPVRKRFGSHTRPAKITAPPLSALNRAPVDHP